MNLRGAKELIYNGNKHSRAYFNGRLVWQKLKPGKFAKDFKYLESSENFEGIWDRQKGALVVYGSDSEIIKVFNLSRTRTKTLTELGFAENYINVTNSNLWYTELVKFKKSDVDLSKMKLLTNNKYSFSTNNRVEAVRFFDDNKKTVFSITLAEANKQLNSKYIEWLNREENWNVVAFTTVLDNREKILDSGIRISFE